MDDVPTSIGGGQTEDQVQGWITVQAGERIDDLIQAFIGLATDQSPDPSASGDTWNFTGTEVRNLNNSSRFTANGFTMLQIWDSGGVAYDPIVLDNAYIVGKANSDVVNLPGVTLTDTNSQQFTLLRDGANQDISIRIGHGPVSNGTYAPVVAKSAPSTAVRLTLKLTTLDSIKAEQLSDVTVTSPANNHILVRSGNVWMNMAISALGSQVKAALEALISPNKLNKSAIQDLNEVPGTGTTGYVLTKTATGYAWQASTGGGMGGGATSLTGLSDVTIATPRTDQILQYDGSEWSNQRFNFDIGELGNVTISSPANNQILQYNSTQRRWVNAANTATGSTTFAALTDTRITTPIGIDQVPKWDGTRWINKADISPDLRDFAEALSGDEGWQDESSANPAQVSTTFVSGTPTLVSAQALTFGQYYENTAGFLRTNLTFVARIPTALLSSEAYRLAVEGAPNDRDPEDRYGAVYPRTATDPTDSWTSLGAAGSYTYFYKTGIMVPGSDRLYIQKFDRILLDTSKVDPGFASWAGKTNTDKLPSNKIPHEVGYGVELLNQGRGITIAAPSTAVRQSLNNFQTSLTLQTNDHGVIIVSIQASVAPGSTSQFRLGLQTSVSEQVFLSVLRRSAYYDNSAGRSGNGVKVATFDVHVVTGGNRGAKQGEIECFIARNQSNQVGTYSRYVPDTGANSSPQGSFALQWEAALFSQDVTLTTTADAHIAEVARDAVAAALEAGDDASTVDINFQDSDPLNTISATIKPGAIVPVDIKRASVGSAQAGSLSTWKTLFDVPTNLNDIDDVTIASVADNQILRYDSSDSQWKNVALPNLTGTLNDLTNVSVPSPTDRQVLQYNATRSVWEAVTVSIFTQVFHDDTLTGTGTSTSNQLKVANPLTQGDVDKIEEAHDLLRDSSRVFTITPATSSGQVGYANYSISGIPVSYGSYSPANPPYGTPSFSYQAPGSSVTNEYRILSITRTVATTNRSLHILVGGRTSFVQIVPDLPLSVDFKIGTTTYRGRDFSRTHHSGESNVPGYYQYTMRLSATETVITSGTPFAFEVLLPADGGRLLPNGGTDGQVLTKTSATDYAVAWEDAGTAQDSHIQEVARDAVGLALTTGDNSSTADINFITNDSANTIEAQIKPGVITPGDIAKDQTDVTKAAQLSTWKTVFDIGGGGNLNGLTDVTISSPADGQGLVYDSATSTWKNQAIVARTPGVPIPVALPELFITRQATDPADVVTIRDTRGYLNETLLVGTTLNFFKGGSVGSQTALAGNPYTISARLSGGYRRTTQRVQLNKNVTFTSSAAPVSTTMFNADVYYCVIGSRAASEAADFHFYDDAESFIAAGNNAVLGTAYNPVRNFISTIDGGATKRHLAYTPTGGGTAITVYTQSLAGTPKYLAWDPDGRHLYVAEDATFKVYDFGASTTPTSLTISRVTTREFDVSTWFSVVEGIHVSSTDVAIIGRRYTSSRHRAIDRFSKTGVRSTATSDIFVDRFYGGAGLYVNNAYSQSWTQSADADHVDHLAHQSVSNNGRKESFDYNLDRSLSSSYYTYADSYAVVDDTLYTGRAGSNYTFNVKTGVRGSTATLVSTSNAQSLASSGNWVYAMTSDESPIIYRSNRSLQTPVISVLTGTVGDINANNHPWPLLSIHQNKLYIMWWDSSVSPSKWAMSSADLTGTSAAGYTAFGSFTKVFPTADWSSPSITTGDAFKSLASDGNNIYVRTTGPYSTAGTVVARYDIASNSFSSVLTTDTDHYNDWDDWEMMVYDAKRDKMLLARDPSSGREWDAYDFSDTVQITANRIKASSFPLGPRQTSSTGIGYNPTADKFYIGNQSRVNVYDKRVTGADRAWVRDDAYDLVVGNRTNAGARSMIIVNDRLYMFYNRYLTTYSWPTMVYISQVRLATEFNSDDNIFYWNGHFYGRNGNTTFREFSISTGDAVGSNVIFASIGHISDERQAWVDSETSHVYIQGSNITRAYPLPATGRITSPAIAETPSRRITGVGGAFFIHNGFVFIRWTYSDQTWRFRAYNKTNGQRAADEDFEIDVGRDYSSNLYGFYLHQDVLYADMARYYTNERQEYYGAIAFVRAV